jgi:hypothetical protein
MGTNKETKELINEYIGWDNRIYSTIKGLTLRPGETIRAYTAKSENLVNPIVYCFLSLTIAYLVSDISGWTDYGLAKQSEYLKKLYPEITNIQTNKILNFIYGEYGNKLIYIPICIILRYLFFKHRNSSFQENSWFTLFTLGHEYLILIPLLLLIWLTTGVFLWYVATIGAFIFDLWSSKVFYNLSWTKSVVLSILLTLTISLVTDGIISEFLLPKIIIHFL